MEIYFLGIKSKSATSLMPTYRAKGLTVSYCKNLLKGSIRTVPAKNPDYVLLVNAQSYVAPYNKLADRYSRTQLCGPVIYMPLNVFQEME